MGYRRTSTRALTRAERDALPLPLLEVLAGRKSKYGNKRLQVDGIWFDSEAEAKRYGELLLLQRAGQISDLQVHTRLAFEIAGEAMFVYQPDFEYTDHTALAEAGVPVRRYEDVKGVRTAVYKLKKRLIEAQYGITIVEIPV